jgi:Zn-dependent peptidase ImmA (M78 family)
MMPAILALPESHPRRRFVAMLCLVWRELREDGWDRPVEEAAEVLARAILIPDDEFLELQDEPDRMLAERFNVPIEEVARKRGDLGIGPAR